MRFQQIMQKMFVGGKWYVGVRKLNSKDGKWEIVPAPGNTWIADPFMYEANGEHFLFVELFVPEDKKACIGYYKFFDDSPVFQGVIIKNNYHMSYPCVFERKGIHYMIPETSGNDTIEMYRAEKFPDRWVKDCTLLFGVKCVDSTVEKKDDEIRVFTYKSEAGKWKLVNYILDMDSKQLIKRSEKIFSENTGRPAGHFAGTKQKYRLAQDCREKYGEAILAYGIDNDTPYQEHLEKRYSAESIVCQQKYERIHTYNADSKFEVVDLFKEKIDLLHGFKIIKRAYFTK